MTVGSLDQALKAAEEIGYPLVCKLIDKDFLHKTEMGGVVKDITTEEALKDAYGRLVELGSRVAKVPKPPSILVQKQVKGHELLLGLKKDPSFGMVVVCGQGGIYTEVFKDVAHSLTPLSVQEACNALSRLLKGVRGEKGVHLNQIAEVMSCLSVLGEEIGGLTEADINPFIVSAEGCWTVDARFVWC